MIALTLGTASQLHWGFGIAAVVIAAGALVMTLINLRLLGLSRKDAPAGGGSDEAIGVCIPARNEQANLAACVDAVLASDDPTLRVFVYDDQSTDATPEILADLCQRDPRVVSVQTRPLPAGWVGKQWACEQLGQAAGTEYVLFIDADVRLTTDCLRRSRGALRDAGAELISMFPRQVTGTTAEALCVPMIHFLLLSYLPIARMRSTLDPGASAGCGQFLFARRSAYLKSGGHAAFRDSMHDGIKMPRAFRRAGLKSDLFDGTDLASCRMYSGLRAMWRGFAKNAYEGLGNPVLLVFLTLLHAAGHVLPWVVIGIAAMTMSAGPTLWMCVAAVAMSFVQRALLARRFDQPWIGVVLHPVAIVMMTLIQWHSFALALLGKRGWRGRTLSSSGASAGAHAAPESTG
jgi:Glycosyl transferase family 2